ncbi:hypothetical protein XENOCAPTIV_011254, partial [Xenoophorus captivus]
DTIPFSKGDAGLRRIMGPASDFSSGLQMTCWGLAILIPTEETQQSSIQRFSAFKVIKCNLGHYGSIRTTRSVCPVFMEYRETRSWADRTRLDEYGKWCFIPDFYDLSRF